MNKMKLDISEKQQYIEAVSQEIFHKPLNELKWENINTISCNLITRKRNSELDASTYKQLSTHLLSIRSSFPRNKTTYDWMD
jgi:hypothetical protein